MNRQETIPILFSAAPLDGHESIVLERIDELKRSLAFGSSPRRWFGLLRRNTFANAVRASNTIEGYTISPDDAVAAVEGEEPLDPKTESWFANVGYRRAMTLVLQKAESESFDYSVEFLNALHFMLLEHDLTKKPGNLRSRPVLATDSESGEVVYEGPEAEEIGDLLRALVGELNAHNEQHVVVRAAMAHLNLVMIHPWSDGNGRMGRCLQSLILARAGTVHPAFGSVEEYLGRNTGEYYRALAEVGGGSWQPRRGTRAWIRFMLTAHYRQATTLRRRSLYYAEIYSLLESAVASRGLASRVVEALADAGLGYRVRNGTYRKLADISMRAAGRDLKRLVDEGLLIAKGDNRGRHYEASPSLVELMRDIPRPRRVEDPFDELERGPTLPGMQDGVSP